MPAPAQARVILQYFETPWSELESRLPEIAMVGYDALWLPPPQKGTDGRRDVGFAVYDRFDLGDKDQRGTIPTRYGVRDELVSMCDASHRHGVRLFFDVVMNHNGNPSLIENTGVDLPIVGLEGFPDTVAPRLSRPHRAARRLAAGRLRGHEPGAARWRHLGPHAQVRAATPRRASPPRRCPPSSPPSSPAGPTSSARRA